MIQQNGLFKIYQINLDESNIKEFDGDKFDYSKQYQIGKPIFEYHENDVDNYNVDEMRVRGCSHKEKYDRRENLIMFFKHGNKLYSWTQFYDGSKNDKI